MRLTPPEAIALFLVLAAGLMLIMTAPIWTWKFPIIIRSRDKWQRSCFQNAEIQESLRWHIRSLEDTIKDGRAHNAKLLVLSTELRSDLRQAREVHAADARDNRAVLIGLRQEHAGDLQLERSRHDEFVRDCLEKILPAATSAPARSSSPREVQLPAEVVTAIEDASFGNTALESHLERQARIRLKPDNSNASQVAELIRAGEVPE